MARSPLLVFVLTATVFSAGCAVAPRSDDDGDGIADAKDNCPKLKNPKQLDTDQDGKGDAASGPIASPS